MKIKSKRLAGRFASKPALTGLMALGLVLGAPALVSAQQTGESIDWVTLGSDFAHTRFIPASQITPANFESLKTAWVWDGASFQATSGRSTPSYVNGKLYTVAGDRRHVVAIDPVTGETIWSYREPHTFRHEYSMRKDYGKGVGFAEVDGRPVIYIISPGFFLTALDADTGAPLEGFGHEIGVPGFPKTGVVDLQKILADTNGYEFDPYYGIPLETGYITSSSPPIVVNGTVVIGNSAEQGYNQTRIENIPGDIIGIDAKTGAHTWTFNIIPDKGEFGWDTWKDGNGNQLEDPRAYTGENSSWAPMAADPALNMVYLNTNSATIDFYRGHLQGDNLYGSSVVALDATTGERKWHFQLVHKDIWNYDTPTAPVLLDIKQNGRTIPVLAQVSKQAFTYVFNRETGEPIWPIEERAVPQSKMPGEILSATQPFPTKPAPYDMQGLTHDDLIDYTPELRAQAIEALADFEIGPLFHPPLHRDNDLGKQAALWCPGDVGGVNIDGPAAADPTTGTLFVVSRKGCTNRIMAPAQERDASLELPTGTTFAQYAPLRSALVRGPQGLPLFKPPYSRLTAIDLNTGDHKWWIPIGETPDRIKNHPALAGIDVGNTGTGTVAPMTVTSTMLMYSSNSSDGTAALFAVDKETGRQLGKVATPEVSRYGMMNFQHEGKQYVVLQTGSTLTALALPD
ncbi:MAG: PQQ-binding-like beta-propeller repeat protein [Pseudohongiella sp.]|nr:PQQ-binding-like beta-propeller repeat protein [Pseudohongiella sp.]